MSIFGGDGGYQRRGGGMRWIIAIVIAIIGIVGYFSKRSVNPVTGETQYVAMSPDQEKALGLEAAPRMAQEMGGALDPQRDADAGKVADMGRKLAADTDAGKSEYAGNFHYYLLNDPQTINAFALPGGQIFITKALYDRLQNEAQLAGVLGHETGHVIARHSAQQMAKGQLGQMLTTAVAVGASDDRGRGQMAAAAAAMANQMAQLRYSRKDELQADSLGLRYMSQIGYDPSAMLDVMQILKEAASHGGGRSAIFSTHPDPDARIEQIQQILKQNYPNGLPSGFSKGASLH